MTRRGRCCGRCPDTEEHFGFVQTIGSTLRLTLASPRHWPFPLMLNLWTLRADNSICWSGIDEFSSSSAIVPQLHSAISFKISSTFSCTFFKLLSSLCIAVHSSSVADITLLHQYCSVTASHTTCIDHYYEWLQLTYPHEYRLRCERSSQSPKRLSIPLLHLHLFYCRHCRNILSHHCG